VATGDFSRWLRGWGVKLITELHLVPRLRMGGDVPLVRHVRSRRGFLILCRDNFAFYWRLYSKLKGLRSGVLIPHFVNISRLVQNLKWGPAGSIGDVIKQSLNAFFG